MTKDSRKDETIEAWDLDVLAEADGLIEWMSSQFGDVRGLDVVEVGAGIGTFTHRLISSGARSVLAVEPDPPSFSRLEERFSGLDQVDLAQEDSPGSSALLTRPSSADLVITSNVLEHIDDWRSALKEMISTLRPDGRIFVLVPAGPWLYGSLDRQFGHYRRYRKADLESAAVEMGLRDFRVRYFNALGIPGWWLRGRTGANTIGRRSLAAYELLLRFWRPIESRFEPPTGLSLILEGFRSDQSK
jgi:SAM-dependent methyltransferase